MNEQPLLNEHWALIQWVFAEEGFYTIKRPLLDQSLRSSITIIALY